MRLARLDLGGDRALRNLAALFRCVCAAGLVNLSGCEKLADISAACTRSISRSAPGSRRLFALLSCASLVSVELLHATSLTDA